MRAKFTKLVLNVSMIVIFAIAGVMLVPAVMGYHRYIILTGSMTGTYDAGSLVFDKPVPTSTLKVGDPITYAPPPGASPNHALVTHRIWKIMPGPNGQRAYITKGDANEKPDVWKFMLKQPTQDTVRFHLPYVGYIFMFLSVKEFRTALIGIPALLMGMWMLFGLWRDGGQEV
ncbi:MAG: signal peptidase, partial [Solirubrobacteraceae bacterium]|nr:signal peptidase [Solirubrobacteraceae bacterium]